MMAFASLAALPTDDSSFWSTRHRVCTASRRNLVRLALGGLGLGAERPLAAGQPNQLHDVVNRRRKDDDGKQASSACTARAL